MPASLAEPFDLAVPSAPRRVRRGARSALVCVAVGLCAFWAGGASARAVGRSFVYRYDATSADGSYLAGLVAGAERDTSAASAFLTEALRADPENAELLERAFVAQLSDGDMDNAFASARQLLKRDDNNGLAQLTLGVRDLESRRYASARQRFAKAGSRSDITSNLLIAWSYAGAGESKHAIDALERSNQQQFKIFRDYHEGLIYQYAGAMAQARVHLQSAYRADPQTLRIVDAWARFADRNGDVAEAKRAYQAFDQLLPRHPLITDALAKIAAGQKLDPPIRTAQAGAAEVLYGLGAAGGQARDDLPAMVYLRLALYLAPHDGLAAVTLADLYERLKQHEEAISIYRSIPKSSPLRVNAEVQTALIEDELGRHDQARKDLIALAQANTNQANTNQANTNDVDALIALGNLQRSQKDYAAAAATYSQALAKSGGPSAKSDWSLLYFRGICEERQNHWPAAEADFKKSLALFPNQPLVLNYLGYSWVDRGMNLDAALKMLQTAVELRPDDGFIVDSLGWAYYKLGKYQDAEHVLERAVQLEPADPVVNEHLGDVYWRNGRKLEAHFQWNHARDLGPDKQDLPRILNEIAHGLDQPGASGREQPVKRGG